MHIEDASALISPLLPLHRADNVAEADWMRSFVLSRLCLLALAFVTLPLALAIDPQVIAGSLSIFAAAVVSATAGLVALIFLSPIAALSASALGLGVLALGLLTGDASLGAGIAALIALGCDWLAAPVTIRSRRWLGFVMSGAGALILAISVADLPDAPVSSLANLIPILFAPLCTLAFSLAALRERLARQELISHQQLSRSEGFASAADVAVLFADRAGVVKDANTAAGALLSASSAEITGRSFFDRVLIADRPTFLKATSDAAMQGSASLICVRIAVNEPEASSPRPPRFEAFDLSIRPAPGQAGGVVICMTTGVLPQQGSMQKGPVQGRSELLQTVTHEIRTPMNAILGFSEVLSDPGIMPQRPEQVADYARIIHRSAREAFVITRALADLMRIEDTSFEPESDVISLREIAQLSIAGISGKMSAHQAGIDLDCDHDAHDIIADPRLCQMILSSLLEGMAAHSGPDERVSLSIARKNAVTVVNISARNTDAAAAGGTYFGVIDALCREAAAQCGATCSLSFNAGAVTAALTFVSASPVVALRPALPHPFLVENLSSLRKSA